MPKIVQITAIPREGSGYLIFGLGEDNNMYMWGGDGRWYPA